jgi:uncharacterized protein
MFPVTSQIRRFIFPNGIILKILPSVTLQYGACLIRRQEKIYLLPKWQPEQNRQIRQACVYCDNPSLADTHFQKRINSMRVISLFLCFLLVAGIASAQTTRFEKTSPAMPAEDSKPVSDAVPDVYSLSGQFDKILVLRFKYQTDLLAGLERMVKEQNIRNAVILSGIGSVRSYHFHTVGNVTFPSKNVFVKNTDSPADIANMNGYVIDGRVHAHITFSDPDKAFGGHLEPDTNVFTFAIVTLGVFKDGIDLKRVDDKNYR